MIIGHLHGDSHALSACSLVCHAWKLSSRYHLFRSLVVECNQAGRNIIQDFHVFLDANPDILEVTRSLEFMTYRGSSDRCVELQVLGSITRRFKKVSSVRLTRISWTADAYTDCTTLASETVTELVASGSRTFTPSFSSDTLFSIFLLFPRVTSFELKDHVCAIRAGLGPLPTPDVHLEALVLRDTLLFALMVHSICRTSTLRTLRSLTIMGVVNCQLAGIGELLQGVGSRLQHFGLEIGMVRSVDQCEHGSGRHVSWS